MSNTAKTIDFVDDKLGNVAVAGPDPVKLSGRPSPIDAIKVKPIYRDLTRGGTPAPPPVKPVAGPSGVSTEAQYEPANGPSGVTSVKFQKPVAGPFNVSTEIGPETFIITIREPKANILARTGDPIGTIAFATDTKDIYVFNTTGFDKWSSYEDN